MKWTKLLIAGLLLFCFGCNAVSRLEKMQQSAKKDFDFSKEYISLIQNGKIEEAMTYLPPKLRNEDTGKFLNEVVAVFPSKPFERAELVRLKKNSGLTGTATKLVLEYVYPTKPIIVIIHLFQTDDEKVIVNWLEVNQLRLPAKDMYAFTFQDKSFIHILFLIWIVLVPLFIIFTVVVALRTPIKKKKWLWILFILIGIFGIHFNWATTEIIIRPSNFKLLGSAFTRYSTTGAWLLKVSLPIGAILFWVKRKKFLQAAAMEKEENSDIVNKDQN